MQMFANLTTLIGLVVGIPVLLICLGIGLLIYHWTQDDINVIESTILTLQDYKIGFSCIGSWFNFIARPPEAIEVDRTIFKTPIGSDVICKLYADDSHHTVQQAIDIAKAVYDTLTDEQKERIARWLSQNEHGRSFDFFIEKAIKEAAPP